MSTFPELSALFRIAKKMGDLGELRENGYVSHKGDSFPLLSFHFGIRSRKAPTLVFVAGVHGLEKIGTQVLSAYLDSFIQLLRWDKTLQASLKHSRVVFYPLVNPVGMLLNRRSNGHGVDLMRNAPLDAIEDTIPILGGHRISRLLPWYRGDAGMEYEAQVLCDFIREQCFASQGSLILDIHSGFGLRDSLWFPYAGSSDYFPESARILAMKQLLEKSYGHHTYTIEPQHLSYKTHGDIWDYLDQEYRERGLDSPFIPLTLEMGSWIWVRKNPKQLLSPLGLFNPMLPHRVKRVERRHFILFNFLLKLIASPEAWIQLPPSRLRVLKRHAKKLWYEDEF